MLTNMFNK